MFVLPLARATAVRRSPALSTSFDRVVDRFFDESFDRFVGSAPAAAETRTPALDVFESDTAYTLAFDVPGATREALKVSVEGRRVTLTTVAPQAPAAGADTTEAAPAAEAAALACARVWARCCWLWCWCSHRCRCWRSVAAPP